MNLDDHMRKILDGIITTPPPPPPSGEDILRAMREFMRPTHTVFAAPGVAERLRAAGLPYNVRVVESDHLLDPGSAYVFDHAAAGWWPDEVTEPSAEEV